MPTSLDIAQLAGVSQATVSRALRGDPLVNRITRERIRRLAEQLGYTVDKNASSLRSHQTHTLALLFFEDPTSDKSNINPFFLAMQSWISRTCSEYGYDLLVSFQHMARDWHAEYTNSRKADGLILLGYGDFLAYRGKLEALASSGTRFVRWGASLPDDLGVAVGSDNEQGGRIAAEHLLAQGRRRIAFLGAPAHSPEVMDRWRGYEAALSNAGIVPDPSLRIDATSSRRSGADAIRTLVERGNEFDALVCASDLIAIGAMQALESRARRIPADVAIAGFDDISLASCITPSLTTVAQDTCQAGRLLARTLIDLVEGRRVRNTLLPTRLIVRQSTVPE